MTCTSLDSPPSTASAKQKCLAQPELSTQSKNMGPSGQAGRVGKRAKWASGLSGQGVKRASGPSRRHESKVALVDKAGEEASKRRGNHQKGGKKGFIKRLALWSDVLNWKIGK